MFFPNGNGFLASAPVKANRLVDGVVLEGDGTVTMPDGTIQRPGVESVDAGQVAAGTTLSHGASRAAVIVMKCLNAGGAGVTITAAPNIEAGTFEGQVLLLYCDDDTTNNITINDFATQATSGLRLNAATVVFNARDTLGFVWSTESNEWFFALGGKVANT
jgi:hypothetical protein